MLGERHRSTSSHVRGPIPQRASVLTIAFTDRRAGRSPGAPRSWSGPHCWAPRADQAHPDSRPGRRDGAGRADRRRRRSARGRRRRPGWRRASARRPARAIVGAVRPGRRSSAARPASANFDAARPSRRTPAARSTCVEQRRGGGDDRRRRCRPAPATVVARVIVVNAAVADLERERAGADAVARAGGRRRRRPGGPARGGRRRASWRSWANVSSWPIDLTSRSGSTGRSSRPSARSRGAGRGPRPRLPMTAAGSSAARSPTVATPIRCRRSSVAGRRPTAGRPAARGGRPAPRPGATSNTPGPGRRRRASARGLASTDASLARNLFGRHADRARQAELARRSSPRSRRAIVAPSPSRAPAPVTSRNASSSASGSTSGVTAAKIACTSRLDRRVGRVVAGQEHGRAGTAGGPSPSASPSARRSAGPRRTPPRRRRADRCRRRRPAARAAPVAGAARRRRRTHPCRRGGSCADARMATTPMRPAAGFAGGLDGANLIGDGGLSRTAPAGPAAAAVGQPQPRDQADGLADDALRQLRLAGAAVAELDRELDDAPAGADQPVRHLDLEAVALGRDRLEVHRLERRRPVGAVAGGGVVDGEAEHAGGVAVAPPRQPAPPPRPVLGAPAGHVAAADRQVGAVLDVGQQRRAGRPGRGTGRRRSARTRRRRRRSPGGSRRGTPTRGPRRPLRTITLDVAVLVGQLARRARPCRPGCRRRRRARRRRARRRAAAGPAPRGSRPRCTSARRPRRARHGRIRRPSRRPATARAGDGLRSLGGGRAPTPEQPLSALPSPGARAAAFAAICLAGLAGGLIGYSLVELQCDGDCALPLGLGILVGAVAAAARDERRRRARAAGPRRVARAAGPRRRADDRRRAPRASRRELRRRGRRPRPRRPPRQRPSTTVDQVDARPTSSPCTTRPPRRRSSPGITAARPDDAIVGEEGTDRPGTSGISWYVDPIDGTTNFVYDLPHWAHVDRRRATPTACSSARSTSRRSASCSPPRRGGGRHAQRRPDPLQRPRPTWRSALVATGFGYQPAATPRARPPSSPRLIGSVRDIRRLGSAALDLCYVAAGRFDAYFETGLNTLGPRRRRADRPRGRAAAPATSAAAHPTPLSCSPPPPAIFDDLVRLLIVQ